MSLKSNLYGAKYCAGIVLGCLGILIASTATAAATTTATGPQCGSRFIAANIHSAVLALKATEFCVAEQLPYTVTEVYERIDSLRCNDEASSLIDSLINDYNRQYKAILTTDAQRTVCEQAVSLQLK